MKLNLNNNNSEPDLLREPTRAMQAATKSYVDFVNATHTGNSLLHLTTQQSNLLASLTVYATELNYTAGLTSPIQDQLQSKLSLAGGVLSGTLTLAGLPTLVDHASTKGYVDLQISSSVSKVGDTMTGALTLSQDPTAALHASTKQYVDASVASHADSQTLHLSADQNTFIDALAVTSSEVNCLQGTSQNIHQALETKLSVLGGTLTGNLTLATGVSVFTNKLPVAGNELASKAYVDSKVKGLEWKDPISAGNLISDILSTPPVSPVIGDVYIVASPGAGAWLNKDGFATFYSGSTWEYLKPVPISVGDRFGVALTSTSSVSATLTSSHNNIVTLVSTALGEYVWSVDEISAGSSTLVFDQHAPDFGVTYSYTDEGFWVVSNVSVAVTSGDGLSLIGNAFSVNTSGGVKTFNNNVTLNLDASAALGLNGSNELTLNIDTSDFTAASGVLSLTGTNRSILSNAVSKSAATDVTGTINFVSGGKLVITTAPTSDNDAANKGYVDSLTAALQVSVDTINTTLSVLTTDATTQSLVISGLDTKFNKTGGTITGNVSIEPNSSITLSKTPVQATDVVNKVYVDDTLLTHTGNDAIHVTPSQKALLASIIASAAELNHITGVTSNIQNQLDLKLDLAGGVMTGALTLFSEPVGASHATTKAYVDSEVNSKLNKAGGTVTGQIKNSIDPIVEDDLARKGYVDSVDTSARLYTTNQLNLAFLKSGGIFTGFVTLNADPADALHAATKRYVDAADIYISNTTQGSIDTLTTDLNNTKTRITSLETDVVKKAYVDTTLIQKLDKAGDALTGYLTLHADPTSDYHAVTKRYVDLIGQGLKTRPAVRLATTANLTATYNNGTLGVNATLTATINAALTIDTKPVVLGDRILVRAQTVTLQNGDYCVTQTGSATTPFILRRNTTADERNEIPGSYFFVFDGSALKGTSWVLNVANSLTFNLGTDAITVSQVSGPGSIVASNGINVSGSTIAVRTASTARINVTGSGVDLAVAMASPGTYKSVTVDTYGRVTAATNPTTLVGYGITDAQALKANLTSLAEVTSNAVLVRDLSGAIKTQRLLVAGTGLSVSQDGSSNTVSNITITSNATTEATPDTLVARDSSGNFSAVQVTAALLGNASTATTLLAPVNVQLSGDVTSSAVSFNGSTDVNLAAVLAATGVTAGTYSRVTVDAKGRVTSATNPTTLSGYGVTDAATLAYVDSKVAELEAKLSDLRAYIMGRV